jgi:hypothetical protein
MFIYIIIIWFLKFLKPITIYKPGRIKTKKVKKKEQGTAHVPGGQEKARVRLLHASTPAAVLPSPRALSISLVDDSGTRLPPPPYARIPGLRQALLRARAHRYARSFSSLPAVRNRAPKA